MHDCCDEHNIKFVIGLNGDKTLLIKAKELFETSETPVNTCNEFGYKAKSWKESRRIIVKAENNGYESSLLLKIFSDNADLFQF
jgi:hypothetical protein